MIASIHIIIKRRGPAYEYVMEDGTFLTPYQLEKSDGSLKTFVTKGKASTYLDRMPHGDAKFCEIITFDQSQKLTEPT